MKVSIVKEEKDKKGFINVLSVEWSEKGMFGTIFAEWKDDRWIIDSEMLGIKKTLKILNKAISK